MMGNNFSRRHFQIIYFYNLPRKIGFKILCKCPWNVNAYFLGENKEKQFVFCCIYPAGGLLHRGESVSSYIEIHMVKKKGKRKDQGVPQSQTAALPRHQEEEETDKSKQAQIEQTYEKH